VRSFQARRPIPIDIVDLMGSVEHIHVAPAASVPMQACAHVLATAGVGLAGDRYANATGFWQDSRVSRDLTLVEAEVIGELAAKGGLVVAPGETRRNITTRGIALNDLVERTFWVGDVLAKGTSLCEPCRHLEEVTGKRLLRPLVRRGGLRADVLSSGAIAVGDAIEPVEPQDGVGVLVMRDRKVLLGRRLAAHGRGTWSFPGGKPHPGESPAKCALRELREETSLVAKGGRIVAESLDGFPESRLVFHTRFVIVDDGLGEPRAREPEKTNEWRWFGWDELPAPLFRPISSLVSSGFNIAA
jgi:ADP-ribose pyrophosphatase YjhB (NUDIX family)